MIGTPEERIGAIIRGERLLDPAEIVDLKQMIQDNIQPNPTVQASDEACNDYTKLRRRELLEKIMGWIES